jgi:NAD-reducing hydrogenase large subunit
VARGQRRGEGVGVIEAPRGTLIHHYEVDENDQVTYCNLIVSTTHNNEAMNRAVRDVAEKHLSGRAEITEGMLNHVEVAIRAHDPCLSCATHAMGRCRFRWNWWMRVARSSRAGRPARDPFPRKPSHRLRQPGARG